MKESTEYQTLFPSNGHSHNASSIWRINPSFPKHASVARRELAGFTTARIINLEMTRQNGLPFPANRIDLVPIGPKFFNIIHSIQLLYMGFGRRSHRTWKLRASV